MAESKYEKHLVPLAVSIDEEVIGFCMYCKDPDDQRYWIYVFMIDEHQQGHGYGKAGLIKLLELISQKHSCNEIMIGHKSDNLKAEYLYKSVGFKNTGEVINDEIIKKYEF
nr:GNAT family N-acetyltransferase [Paenibacillus baekrokdamisoli]